MSDRRYIRRDSERSVTMGPGLVIDPFNVRTWPDEMQASHRLRRALHELMPDPRYTLEVGQKPGGELGIRVQSEFGVPSVALEFLTMHREPLITYLTWLELIDEDSEVGRVVGINERHRGAVVDDPDAHAVAPLEAA